MKINRSGLSLIEVLLAVIILGILSTSLLSLQRTLMRGVFSGHAFLERIGFIRSFFVSAEKERLFKKGPEQKKEIEDPVLSLTYRQVRPGSAKLSQYAHLVLNQVEAEWPTIDGKRRTVFSTYMFSPQKEREP